MKHFKILLCSAFLSLSFVAMVQAQSAIPAAGGNSSGTGGTVSYTVGQITYQTISGSTGTVAPGVQQPFEISIVTALEKTEGITLDYKVYPNPAADILTLIIRPFGEENVRFRLYDLNGVLLQDKKIESEVTEISMQNLSASVYLMKIIVDHQEVKTFKIIKK